MLTRSGPFNKKQLVNAALEYADQHNGKVPYKEAATGKIDYVIFEKVGIVWILKEIVMA